MKLKNNDIKRILENISQMFETRMEELSKLDSLVGDGDHGVSMARGSQRALEAIHQLDEHVSIEKIFSVYADGITQGVGGAVGPLFGSIFYEFASVSKGLEHFDGEMYKNAIESATKMVMDLGQAKANDKTMVDAMLASKEAITDTNRFLDLTKQVKEGAFEGVQNTINMQAKRGRSKYRREQSIGFQDAGATSYYYLVNEFYEYLKGATDHE